MPLSSHQAAQESRKTASAQFERDFNNDLLTRLG
jgi:hypothetical protein